MEIKGSVSSKAADEARITFTLETDVLLEDRIMFNQYNYNATKLTIIHYRKNVFVYDIETDPDEESIDCVPYSIGFLPISKTSNFTVCRDITHIDHTHDLDVCQGDDLIDKMFTDLITKWKSDTKKRKSYTFCKIRKLHFRTWYC